jgi:hypothetical protein
MRKMAVTYAKETTIGSGGRANLSAVFEGLALARDCNATAPVFEGARPYERKQATKEYFVSTDTGSDTNPGTEQKPWASIARALVELGKTLSSSRVATTVQISPGVYALAAPLNVTAATSGASADKPVVFQRKTGETAEVSISGGRKLKLQWQKRVHPVNGASIYTAHVGQVTLDELSILAAARAGGPGNEQTVPLIPSLFVNGRRQIRARFPNGAPEQNW